MAIDSHQESLEFLLSERRRYVVPDYQRPYVWGFDQAQDLAEDLLAAWRRDDSDFFLGSIVVIREKGDPVGEVVDGQQRLTTLAIIFAILREFAPEHLKEPLTRYLGTKEDPIRQEGALPRVQVRESDQDFFETYFVRGDLAGLREQHVSVFTTEGQRNMRRSADAIWETFSDLEDTEDLRRFIEFLLAVSLVVIETDNFQNAHRIFGVLNTRGVPLAASDVFKAEILGTLAESDRAEYAKKWDDSLKAVGHDPDAFFRHLLVSQSKSTLRRSLSEEFNSRIKEGLLREIGGKRFIDDVLLPLSDAFVVVNNSLNDDVAEVLDLLHDHHSGEWKPVAMWVVSKDLETSERDRLLRGVDRVFGVHTLAGSDRTKRSEAMASLLSEFERHWSTTGEAPPNDVFDLPDSLIYNALAALQGELPRSAKRLTLLRRAHWQATGADGLLPPDSTWISVFPSKPLPEVSDTELAEPWRSKLGSMVLSITDNARVRQESSWAGICLLTRPGEPQRHSPATLLDPQVPPSEAMLRERHSNLVRLVAENWGITEDSAGTNLLVLDEGEALQLAGRGRVSRSKATRLADVVQVGLLKPGDVLVWVRKNLNETFEVTVTQDGKLELPKGQRVTSPSAASKALSGANVQALDVWRRRSDNKSLRDLWSLYQARFSERAAKPTAGTTTRRLGTQRWKPTPRKDPAPKSKSPEAPEPSKLPKPTGATRPKPQGYDNQPNVGPTGEARDWERHREALTWHTYVTPDLARGRTTPIPSSLAVELGITPGSSKTFTTRQGEDVLVAWTSDGPTIGPVAKLVARRGFHRGDLVSLRFSDNGVLTARPTPEDWSRKADVTPEVKTAPLKGNVKRPVPNQGTTRTRPPGPPRPAASPIETAVRQAKAAGAKVSDNRSKGALWIYDNGKVEHIIQSAKEAGVRFTWNTTNRKGLPGWYTNDE